MNTRWNVVGSSLDIQFNDKTWKKNITEHGSAYFSMRFHLWLLSVMQFALAMMIFTSFVFAVALWLFRIYHEEIIFFNYLHRKKYIVVVIVYCFSMCKVFSPINSIVQMVQICISLLLLDESNFVIVIVAINGIPRLFVMPLSILHTLIYMYAYIWWLVSSTHIIVVVSSALQ